MYCDKLCPLDSITINGEPYKSKGHFITHFGMNIKANHINEYSLAYGEKNIGDESTKLAVVTDNGLSDILSNMYFYNNEKYDFESIESTPVYLSANYTIWLLTLRSIDYYKSLKKIDANTEAYNRMLYHPVLCPLCFAFSVAFIGLFVTISFLA